MQNDVPLGEMDYEPVVVDASRIRSDEARTRPTRLRLKLATLQIVRSDFPDHRMLHSWTDPENAAMYRTHTDFGFVARERMHDVQRKDA
jgi:hypothetical protein